MEHDNTFSVMRLREGDAVVVVPQGEIDLATVDAVRDEVAAGRREAQVVVLDLRAVTFMDSSGLRLLVEVDRAAQEDPGAFRFALVRGTPQVQRLFDIAGLSERLAIIDEPAQVGSGGGGPG